MPNCNRAVVTTDKHYTVFLESDDASHEGYYFQAPDQLVYCVDYSDDDEPQPEPWAGSVEDIAKNLNLMVSEALKMSQTYGLRFEIVLAPTP